MVRLLLDRKGAEAGEKAAGSGAGEKPAAATMEEWGRIDQASMIDHLASEGYFGADGKIVQIHLCLHGLGR